MALHLYLQGACMKKRPESYSSLTLPKRKLKQRRLFIRFLASLRLQPLLKHVVLGVVPTEYKSVAGLQSKNSFKRDPVSGSACLRAP